MQRFNFDYEIDTSNLIEDVPELFADEKRKANRIIDGWVISEALGTKCKYSDEEIKHAFNFIKAITPPPEPEDEDC